MLVQTLSATNCEFDCDDTWQILHFGILLEAFASKCSTAPSFSTEKAFTAT